MELIEILQVLGIPVSTAIIVLALTFIKIPKVEVNIWQLLGKALSKGLVGPVMEEIKKMDAKIDSVDSKLEQHIENSGAAEATSARNRILRFSDEIICGQQHTKEHFRDVLLTIDAYEDYCREHPDFPNNRCLIAIQNIKDEYMDKCKNNSFVKIERLTQVMKDLED